MQEIDDMPRIYDELYKEFVKRYEDLIIQVLMQLLGRPPVEEDFRDCVRIYSPGELMDYTLAYKGINLGYVKFNFEGFRPGVGFLPVDTVLKNGLPKSFSLVLAPSVDISNRKLCDVLPVALVPVEPKLARMLLTSSMPC